MGKYIVHKPIEFDRLSAAWKKRVGVSEIDNLGDKYAAMHKYDGCHAIVKLTGPQTFEIVSRTGEVVRSMDHVGRFLLQRFQTLLFRGQQIAVLGEAWARGTAQRIASGWFRKHDAQTLLQFAAFDSLPLADFEAGVCEVPFQTRYAGMLSHLRGFTESDTVFPCPMFMPGTYGPPTALAAMLQSFGASRAFDGAILADLDAGWKAGAGSDGAKIKVKPRPTFDLLIVGFIEGKGKYAGTLGAVQLKFNDGTLVEASGGTDDERAEMWANQSKYLNKIGEVSALERLPSGELREGVFKGVRFDKVDID
jgi:DNA ligase-1